MKMRAPQRLRRDLSKKTVVPTLLTGPAWAEASSQVVEAPKSGPHALEASSSAGSAWQDGGGGRVCRVWAAVFSDLESDEEEDEMMFVELQDVVLPVPRTFSQGQPAWPLPLRQIPYAKHQRHAEHVLIKRWFIIQQE